MKDPLVSVILPVFNGERTLQRALNSILQQSYRSLEITVVDDGSTDQTAAVAQSNSNIRYVRQQNMGPAAARNCGAQQAAGAMLAFLDADDAWHPSKIKKQVDHLLTHPKLGFVLCQMTTVVEKGASLSSPAKASYYQSNPAAVIPSALLVKREVFDQVGFFNPAFKHTDDSDWFFRARDLKVKHAVLPEVLLTKHIHPHSVSSHTFSVHQELLQQIRASLKRRHPGEKRP